MKILIVYFHLISACLAIGTLIIQDYKFLMLRTEKLKAEDLLGLENTAKVMTFTL